MKSAASSYRSWATRVAAGLALALLCSEGFAQERRQQLSNGYSQPDSAFFRAGFWWAEDNPGFGLDLHPAGDGLVGIWASYDEQGDPTWYFGSATEQADGSWDMPLTRYTVPAGGWTGSAPAGETVGNITLRFDGGFDATMGWQLGEASGSERISPLIATDQPTALDQTGFWYDPARSGYGYSIVTQGDVLLSVLYYYDSQGTPRWAWGDNLDQGAGSELSLLSFRGTCPGCAPAVREVTPAGTLRLRFLSETLGFAEAELELEGGSWQTGQRTIAMLTDRPSGRNSDADMMPVTNDRLLSTFLDSATSSYPLLFSDSVNFSPAQPALPVSTTNLQESGVDEPDLVKSDGEFLYAVDTRTQPASSLRVLRIAEDGLRLDPVATLTDSNPRPPQLRGIFLTRTGSGQRLLVSIAGDAVAYYSPLDWFSPVPWRDGRTTLRVYRLDNPDSPELGATIEFDGTVMESRVIEDTLYVVSRGQADARTNAGSSAAGGNEDSVPLDERLPALTVNGVRAGPLVDPASVLLPPPAPGFTYPELITIAAFDLNDLARPPQTVTYLGLAEAAYVSRDNVYLSSSRWGYSFSPVVTEVVPEQYSSDIHRFSLSGGTVRYAGSGTVEGFVGATRLNPSFAFSEADGHLRVVSQGSWDELGEHRLTVLKLDEGGLTPVGHAPNANRPQRLGKPGEQLFGLRFMGQRLYAVTFKNIDPLYVVDLSEPSDPFIAGALEIPGFSDYLHPINDRLLLGFGKNAVDAQGPGDGFFAWYQGLQLSLFDVADPSTPRLLKRLDIGRRGSESSLLGSHRAFASLPADPASGRPLRLAIPLVVHDAASASDVSNDPAHFYDYRYTGLGMFEVTDSETAPDLVLEDVMITHTAEDHPGRDPYRDGAADAARSILTGSSAIFFLRGELFSSDWGLGVPVNGPF